MPKHTSSKSKQSHGSKQGRIEKWSCMRNKDKEAMRLKFKDWLSKNYIPSKTSCLPRELVYQHFKSCNIENFQVVSDSAIFGRLVAYTFPHVRFRRFGSRGKSKYYYHGLDTVEENSYCQKLSQERIYSSKVISIPDEISEFDADVDTALDILEEIKTEPTEFGDVPLICSCTGDCSTCRINWINFSCQNKETHLDWLHNWLDGHYEVWPQVCVLRQTVYDHYRTHCKLKDQVPATPAIFGKMLVKKFPRLTMRRLGSRGCSKYYYMGIDIRPESEDFMDIRVGRLYCPGGKPKFSRAFNGTPGR